MQASTPSPAAPIASATGSATEDALGYDAYAKTLWARIEQGLNRDAITGKLGDDPLVVGIFGEWGAGKSFLLGRILKHAFAFEQGRIDRRKGGIFGNAGFGLTVPVLFQPWKYEHEEHLHVPLILHILEALKRDLAASESITERAKGSFDKGGDWFVQHMKPAVAEFEKLLAATALATAPVTAGASLVSIPAMRVVKWLLSKLPSKKPDKPNLPATIRYSDEGRYFYEIHQHLKAVTRPAAKGNHAKGYTQGKQSQHDKLDINFVVFVDDLDRCLPEKAVAVLELIKTVFNVESFAFVLALDDEVIERGIGHRYKDYSFGNKKSEMPITGFEYLEKIVHLPFRLPALTRDDALRFLRQKEQALLKLKVPHDANARHWFAPVLTHVDARTQPSIPDVPDAPDPSASPDNASGARRVAKNKIELNLAQLVLAAFDGYVPRKLDRIVELFHQVVSIAAERGRPLGVALGDDADPRVVLALVLLQLFQPELYRCIKRTGNGFDVLRASMKDNTLSSVFSDQDLLHWACYGTKPPSDTPNETVSGSKIYPPVNVAETLRRIAKLDEGQRYPAQRIRLPIVERMLEHRAAQRHVFDPLKLFAELNKSFADVPLAATDTRSYYSLLTVERVLDVATVASELTRSYTAEVSIVTGEAKGSFLVGDHTSSDIATASSPPAPSPAATGQKSSVTLTDVRSVYAALISAEASDQADVANRAGLKAGDVLAASSASDLFALVNGWIGNASSSATKTDLQQRLLRGLQHLAPHLASDDGARFWSLVKDCVSLPTQPNTLLDEPKVGALYADVRAALGQDDRFEAAFPSVMTKRFGNHTQHDEPLPGFVRVPAGEFVMRRTIEITSPPRPDRLDNDFYIARTLTTVSQYLRFVEANGYEARETIWGRHGVEWLAKNEARHGPNNWDEQLAHPSHPVTKITWFEARAYAQWLSLHLRETMDAADLQRYDVHLPTEPQWVRAALASSLGAAHEGRWPWGDEAVNIPHRANVRATELGMASAVGLFAANAIGLHDMAGNVWEWMDNRYESVKGKAIGRAQPVDRYEHVAEDEMSLRGGSWFVPADLANCFSRLGNKPDYWGNGVGVRVVLSLAR